MPQSLKIACQRYKTHVVAADCKEHCKHHATCKDLAAYVPPVDPPPQQQEVAMGDGQSHGADESRDRRVDVTPKVIKPVEKPAEKPVEKKKIKNQMVTFVETAPNSNLFELANISMADLVTINLANRRVIAAPEATEF